MMGLLDEKVALVTGGSTGIGLAIARRFAAEGATVYLTGRHQAELDAAVAAIGERAIGVQSDVSKLGDLDRLFEEIKAHSGRLDVVVANAGVGELARLGEITEEQYTTTFDINVKGTLFTVQKALPLLPDGASVIVLSSTNASMGVEAMSVYSATKAADRNFARTWSAELADRGIRVNAISPGPIETPACAPWGSRRRADGRWRRLSGTRFRWAGRDAPRKSPPRPSSLPRTRAPSRPEPSSSSTAASSSPDATDTRPTITA
jgi:NAD(P)-dependent dehydrogenase (short-subunit alcohol dehydrogenase family)